MSQARTLGELRVSQHAARVPVREEMRRNLLRKLDCRTRLDAVRRAGELGLIA